MLKNHMEQVSKKKNKQKNSCLQMGWVRNNLNSCWSSEKKNKTLNEKYSGLFLRVLALMVISASVIPGNYSNSVLFKGHCVVCRSASSVILFLWLSQEMDEGFFPFIL